MTGDFDKVKPDFREYVVAFLKANGATAESLEGLEDWELFAKIALKVEKPFAYVKGRLRRHFEANQKALKEVMESLKRK